MSLRDFLTLSVACWLKKERENLSLKRSQSMPRKTKSPILAPMKSKTRKDSLAHWTLRMRGLLSQMKLVTLVNLWYLHMKQNTIWCKRDLQLANSFRWERIKKLDQALRRLNCLHQLATIWMNHSRWLNLLSPDSSFLKGIRYLFLKNTAKRKSSFHLQVNMRSIRHTISLQRVPLKDGSD